MEDRKERQIKAGVPEILGVTKRNGGYNFAVEAPMNAQVSLLLYRKGETRPENEILLTQKYRTGEVVSVFIPRLSGRNYEYNYKINDVIVQDPYARKIVGRRKFAGCSPGTMRILGRQGRGMERE